MERQDSSKTTEAPGIQHSQSVQTEPRQKEDEIDRLPVASEGTEKKLRH